MDYNNNKKLLVKQQHNAYVIDTEFCVKMRWLVLLLVVLIGGVASLYPPSQTIGWQIHSWNDLREWPQGVCYSDSP
jgi:hypothetical protein